MHGAKILITGPTGQVASPIAQALAVDNEVWGIARFTNTAAREALEKAGVRCETVNLAAGDFTGIPSDFDYVLNLAVATTTNPCARLIPSPRSPARSSPGRWRAFSACPPPSPA